MHSINKDASKTKTMFKILLADIIETINWWRKYTHTKRHAFKLKLAIKLADMKQTAFNKQYFVILTSGNKLIAINNNDVKMLKRNNLLDKKMDGMKLRRLSFYYTAYGQNNKMSKQEQIEAKHRYITYARKYLK